MLRARQMSGILVVSVLLILVGAFSALSEVKQININTASAEELAALDKVGPVIAGQIVEYRTLNGPFKSPEDLKKVKGVGDKIFELNKDRITVEAPAPPSKPAGDPKPKS